MAKFTFFLGSAAMLTVEFMDSVKLSLPRRGDDSRGCPPSFKEMFSAFLHYVYNDIMPDIFRHYIMRVPEAVGSR